MQLWPRWEVVIPNSLKILDNESWKHRRKFPQLWEKKEKTILNMFVKVSA